MKKILAILPAGFRRRSPGVVLTLFARAVLNFAGIAALFPLLTLLLDPATFAGEGFVARLFDDSGIASRRVFVAAAGAAAVLVILLKSAADRRLARIENRYIEELHRTLARQLYRTFHDRGMAFIDREEPLALTRRVLHLTRAFTTGVVRPAATLLAEGVLTGMTVAALAVVSPQAAGLLLALFLPAGALCGACLRRRIARCAEAENRARSEQQRIVAETFRGYADIELCGAFPELLRAFDRTQERIGRARMQSADLAQLPAFVVENGLAVGLVLPVIVGFGKEDSALLFGVFAVAALRLMPSVRNLLNGWALIRRNRYAVRELYRIGMQMQAVSRRREAARRTAVAGAEQKRGAADTSRAADSSRAAEGRAAGSSRAAEGRAAEERLPFEREIRMQGIAFRYPGGSREVIRDLGLVIRKGERIGIRGDSGVGKSTLLRLLAGLYTPSAGEIRIDDTPLTPDNLGRWQPHIGYVSQHPFFRFGTLAENIAPGVPPDEIDPGRLAEAIRTARLEPLVAGLPRGLDTPIGFGGGRLSGGERQRIAIARALYRQADLLLFDEATSALDNRTETEFIRSLEELSARRPGVTMVWVSHREGPLAGCRRVVELRV